MFLKVLYEDSRMVTLTAPYVAGFLAFRETPFLLEALQRLEETQPELLPQVRLRVQSPATFRLLTAIVCSDCLS